MEHDQLFKELLKAFFAEFVELFFPDVAARLNFAATEFLDTELFTDVPHGRLRRPDLLARVSTRDGQPELILLHVEVQAKRDRNVRRRMFEYYALLRLRLELPVFPVVVYLARGAGGQVRESYTEQLFGKDILRFRYFAIGLPDLSADDYQESDNPLASALTALMKPSRLGRIMQKALSLRKALGSPVDEARRSLLVYVVDKYLGLSASEEERLDELVGREEMTSVVRYVTSWELRAEQKVLLRQMRLKFGELPIPVVEHIQDIMDEDQLLALTDRVLTANSLEEMGLPAPKPARRRRQ